MILRQRGALFPWSPVALAVGIGLYFAAPTEPDGKLVALLGVGALVVAGLALRAGPVRGPPLWAAALVLLGVTLAAARAQSVAAPVLGWRHYGPVQGRVVQIDRSASDAVRLTLDRVYLPGVSPAKTPARVRISLHGDQAIQPAPGQLILSTAHLSPPGGPVEPGGFDFQRHTWFDRLGAIGYTRVPVMVWSPAQPRALPVFRARMALSSRIRDVLPGDTGAFAAAITAGDRSALSDQVTTRLRRTNLAHLLAISGLHMGLVAGFVFALVRVAGAAVPYTALNWPIRSIAALTAVAAGAGYLALSGGAIATERAFVMATVAFVALVLGRRAISLRGLAMAALVVLILRPEALLSPGFQMSFAATTALVAVFAALRGVGSHWPKWAKGLFALVVSSTVAGLATAPVGAAHFNTLSHYGLIANLTAVPVMGLLVMPAAVLAVIVMPLGLEALPLTVMGWGLNWILWVAAQVADLPGAVGYVVAPNAWVLPLFAGGGLVIALWQGRGRWTGVVPLIAAGVLWAQAERPDILIEDRGMLVGVMTDQGRAVSREKSASFTARVWLENDGDGAEQIRAAARWPGQGIHHLTGKRAAAVAKCDPTEILILNHDPPAPLPCQVFAPATLRDTGAVAIWITPEGRKLQTARAVAGRRLWNDAIIRAERLWRQ
ncbi:ComEC/Rec2 family competence protein [Pseudooceanicola sp. MF1-13]|uniref:ComEC/Rec2 family competence protein n=1 Tax=Pseudooceanicola sp. MF1-13 TaxID=3379095 RepID=UPI003891E0FE